MSTNKRFCDERAVDRSILCCDSGDIVAGLLKI